jgi:FtsP/CotA-like multicopper oxidase with cupredoxin domain
MLTVLVIGLAGLVAALPLDGESTFAQGPVTILNATAIPKFVEPLIIPPAMPRTGTVPAKGGKNIDYYEIAVRQFDQYILPQAWSMAEGIDPTTVWSYGSVQYPGTIAEGGSFNYPSLTIEAEYKKPVRVKWINDLVDENGNYLPHLLPVDQTLHWANPPGGNSTRDTRGNDPDPYTGPVPIITHVHGAHTYEESDGFPEAWYLPDANDIPAGNATVGSYYDQFNQEFQDRYNESPWAVGEAVFQYPNDQRATTLWYHDHTLGMTRVNVYAGPAGFYLLRGGPDDVVIDSGTGEPAILPGGAPGKLLKGKGRVVSARPVYEIPIVVQDRTFNEDGSLFYPDNRAFFEGLNPEQLQIPFIPDEACDGNESDVSPIWQPEFFGNTMVVNGKTWPFQEVEPRTYRFRLLNGANSRFLILQFDDPNVDVWQIGADGGFLATPVNITGDYDGQLLLGPAERADVIVDFSGLPVGNVTALLNLGPDEPYGGGEPGVDFDIADPDTTGQVMQFRVVPLLETDLSTPPSQLLLPAVAPIGPPDLTRQVSLNEEESKTVRVVEENGNITIDCDDPAAEAFGPIAALLGTYDPITGNATALLWSDAITENPAVGATETWEIYNFTADAHPIHIHLVQFQVVDRQALAPVDADGVAVQPAFTTGTPRPPEAWETGFKDTVIVYPGEVTRVQARFDLAGLYVWHCHIIEHEDNEMMRPYRIGPTP